jgi:glycosyltransferase involved in cell wall biosynthesis
VLLVGRGSTTLEREWTIQNDLDRSSWARTWLSVARHLSGRSAKVANWIAEPNRRYRIRAGYEDFEFPATLHTIASMVRGRGTILHLHNLHGGYFDLRALPMLSEFAPMVVTLHDQWLFTGHCAQSFECERWKIGCGECPDLTIYPGIPRDRTAENFRLKRDIFLRTRLFLTTPSRWLMRKAEGSLLAPAIEEARVIPNGIDTGVFRPGSSAAARSRLRLPKDSWIVLCAGSIARVDQWTDRDLLTSAVRSVDGIERRDCTIVFLGSTHDSDEQAGAIRLIHRRYEDDPHRVAAYYRASDIYVHPSRADTFPTSILEALACGLPVIATAVGGIPEQIKSIWNCRHAPAAPSTTATGILLDAGDEAGLRNAIETLLLHDELRTNLGLNAAAAGSEFSISAQAQSNLDWYGEILSRHHPVVEPRGTPVRTPRPPS